MDGVDVPFQSTLPMRGATHKRRLSLTVFDVSIHAPYIGSDHLPTVRAPGHPRFNPRSLHRERHKGINVPTRIRMFQSTLPIWGATHPACQIMSEHVVSIHAPYIGSDVQLKPDGPVKGVSIHAPYIGSDITLFDFLWLIASFNPRSLHRERLAEAGRIADEIGFNPRSLHRERRGHQRDSRKFHCFNPRSLHRERLFVQPQLLRLSRFNPRSLHRERRRR